MADDLIDDPMLENMRPADASLLGSKQLAEELDRRGCKPTGFPDEDIRALQKFFNAEFEAEKEERMRVMKEMAAKRRLEEEALRRQRLLEKQEREEREALAEDSAAAYLLDLVRQSRTPADLALQRFSVPAIRAFVKALGANASLRGLSLVGCKLGDDSGTALGASLATNGTLLSVQMDYNNFGPATAHALAAGLAANTTLRGLSLENNPLTTTPLAGGGAGGGGGGGSQNAPASPGSPTGDGGGFLSLHSPGTDGVGSGSDGSGGDIEGVRELCAAIASHPSLQSVNLFQTGLGRRGGRLLAQAVRSNPRILSVQVSPLDGIEAEDLLSIAEVLKANAAAKEAAEEDARVAEGARRKEEAAAKAAVAEAGLKESAVAWTAAEMEARANARAEAEFQRHKAEELARYQREVLEKERQAKLRAEEAAKAEKAKKKK